MLFLSFRFDEKSGYMTTHTLDYIKAKKQGIGLVFIRVVYKYLYTLY